MGGLLLNGGYSSLAMLGKPCCNFQVVPLFFFSFLLGSVRPLVAGWQFFADLCKKLRNEVPEFLGNITG